MLLEPAPAAIIASSPSSSTISDTSATISSSLSVGDSPVVPQTTSPSEPLASR